MKSIIVMGSGGHTKRGMKVGRKIEGEVKYIIPFESEVTCNRVGDKGIKVISPRYKAKDNLILTVFRTLFLFLHSLFILLLERPDNIISTGSGLSYPVLLMSKFLGVKTVYIESPSRVYFPSKTGSLLLNKVDLWLSPWEELKNSYNVSYLGCLC